MGPHNQVPPGSPATARSPPSPRERVTILRSVPCVQPKIRVKTSSPMGRGES
jgi:hypothetical protein